MPAVRRQGRQGRSRIQLAVAAGVEPRQAGLGQAGLELLQPAPVPGLQGQAQGPLACPQGREAFLLVPIRRQQQHAGAVGDRMPPSGQLLAPLGPELQAALTQVPGPAPLPVEAVGHQDPEGRQAAAAFGALARGIASGRPLGRIEQQHRVAAALEPPGAGQAHDATPTTITEVREGPRRGADQASPLATGWGAGVLGEGAGGTALDTLASVLKDSARAMASAGITSA